MISPATASRFRPASRWWTPAVLLLALLGLIANLWIPLNTFRELESERAGNLAARQRLNLLNATMLNMVDAETGERGFVITGDLDFLQPYHLALATLEQRIAELDRLFGESEDRQQWQALREKIRHSREFLHKVVLVRQKEGSAPAIAMVGSEEGKRRMDAVRSAATKLIATQQERRDVAVAAAAERMARSRLLMSWLAVFDIALFGYAFFLLRQTIVTDRRREAQLQILHANSERRADLLGRTHATQALQSRLVNSLQSVQDLDEAYQVIEKSCAQLFPDNAGAFYVRNNSRDYFERVAHWGSETITLPGFEPHACWAARNGNLYRFDAIASAMPCRHLDENEIGHLGYLCVPMSSNGEMTGVLTLLGRRDAQKGWLPVSTEDEAVAQEVVEKIGLAVTNLRLRDTLRHSSIIDALTGLYNRRYFEETLRRELSRAERGASSVGLMMLDLDHFKRFNDSFGHDAGDLVLREAARAVKSSGRKSDFACRLGGEEFVMVMPDAGLDILLARAEAVRLAIKEISISYGGTHLGPISISIGVACYPQHGNTLEALGRAADAALYRAKANGRDCVVAA